jgi:DNA-binding NtrC family response regulator
MLVDDEPAYLDLLEQLLSEHLACPVYSFAKPADALRELDRLNVGLIVTDYHMPEMNGFQFLAAARQLKPGLQAIMITAHDVTLTDGPAGMGETLKAVVRKPFRWTSLAEHISQHWPGTPPPFPVSTAERPGKV